jgi:pimeloyl-ACP methyl ester carboxylesterase
MGARQMLALGGAAFGALAALNAALGSAPVPPVPPASGNHGRFAWSEGTIHYTFTGAGAPVVLVHGPGIAASSYEMRYLSEALAGAYTVFALDLLGFGLSDRPDVAYSGALYARLLHDFIAQVVQQPAIVMASGLSGWYALAAASAEPDQVQALVLSSPPSLTGKERSAGSTRRLTDTLLGAPLIGQSIFNARTGRNTIRAELRDRIYANPELVTESMVDAQFAMARLPSARYAVQALLLGKLALPITAILEQSSIPLLVVFGADANQDPRPIAAAYVRHAPRTQIAFIERAGSLPHEEQAERVAAVAVSWLSGIAAQGS